MRAFVIIVATVPFFLRSSHATPLTARDNATAQYGFANVSYLFEVIAILAWYIDAGLYS
jgi:hypothetical protein